MSDVEAGGATIFPYVGARVKPKKVRQNREHPDSVLPLIPNINKYIILTICYIFPMGLVEGICLSINACYLC